MVLLKCNKASSVVNGCVGILEYMGEHCLIVALDTGKPIIIPKRCSTRSGFPVVLGCARTLAKVQGQTCDAVHTRNQSGQWGKYESCLPTSKMRSLGLEAWSLLCIHASPCYVCGVLLQCRGRPNGTAYRWPLHIQGSNIQAESFRESCKTAEIDPNSNSKHFAASVCLQSLGSKKGAWLFDCPAYAEWAQIQKIATMTRTSSMNLHWPTCLNVPFTRCTTLWLVPLCCFCVFLFFCLSSYAGRALH